MTAKGKITATGIVTELAAGRPARVLMTVSDVSDYLAPATRKTGMETLEITEYRTREVEGIRRSSRHYRFLTSAGWTGWVVPIQTFILAPEDAPAVRRAHAEALEIESTRNATVAKYPNPEDVEESIRAAQERQMAGVPEGWETLGPAGLRPKSEAAMAEHRGRPRIQDQDPAASIEAVAPFLSPIEHPEQEPRGTTEQRLLQLLAMIDAGAIFELHSDGWWRDRQGLTGSFLDTVALRDTIAAAGAVGLVRVVPGGRINANPTLAPVAAHLAVHTTGRRKRSFCRIQVDPMLRLRLTHRLRLVTCPACLDMVAEQRWAAARLTEAMTDCGIVVGATVTIHRGTQRYEVVEIAEDMARVAPLLTEEDRASIEASGGKIRELQWISWDLLHAVPTAKA